MKVRSVCLLTHLCCHVYAHAPAMPGLWKKGEKKKHLFKLKYCGPCWEDAYFSFGFTTKKVNMLPNKITGIPVLFWTNELQKKKKATRIYELILRCELIPREHTHAYTSPLPPESALLLMLVLVSLAFPVSGNLISHPCRGNLETAACVRKGLAICFVWHLLQQLSFLSNVCCSCWRFSAFLFITVHLIFLCSVFPYVEKPKSYAPTLFSSSLGEWDAVVDDQSLSSSLWWRKTGGSFRIWHRFFLRICVVDCQNSSSY